MKTVKTPYRTTMRMPYDFKTPSGFARRKRRLRMVYDGRYKQLKTCSEAMDSRGCERAVMKYARARKAWRNFRGLG